MPSVTFRVGALAICTLLFGVTHILSSGDGTPSGAAVGGVALSISSSPSPYRVGSPIWIDTDVRNRTSEPIDVMRYMSSIDVKVTDLQTGRAMAAAAPWLDCLDVTASPSWFEIKRGQSHLGAVRIDRCFQSVSPGVYSVQIAVAMTTGRFGPGYSGVGTQTLVTLESNVLEIHVLPLRSPVGWQSPIYEDSPSETTSGPASRGFALALSVAPSGNDLSAPLYATVELRNVSGRVQNAFFGSRFYDYTFQIVNRQTGHVVPRDPNAKVLGDVAPEPWNSRPIYPDTSLYGRFWLSGLYRFPEGGSYAVRVTGHPIIGGQRVTLQSNSTDADFEEYRSVPYPGHSFAVHLETNKQTYQLHEPIKIRILITNVTDEAYSIWRGWPTALMLPLVVQDSHGAAIAPTLGRDERFCSQCGSDQLAPGETITIGWMDINEFWYALTQPGTYTMTTSLHGLGFKKIAHGTEHFGMSGEDKSNTVRIQIVH